MKERPILFSAPMVRAILEGRKTQTRRVMKIQPTPESTYKDFWYPGKPNAPRGKSGLYGQQNGDKAGINYWMQYNCPYGMPAIPGHLNPDYHEPSRLWVRETLGVTYQGNFEYMADRCEISDERGLALCQRYGDPYNFSDVKKVPSIFMPRWASRILLEVVSVRVERLQDISRGDAMAEGCPFPNLAGRTSPVDWFKGLWESINGAGSWDANPWVWVVEFRQVQA